jgi:hypothetical protein
LPLDAGGKIAMTAAEVLKEHGTLLAAEVVELAAAAGLELAAAATLLEKESSGGRNIYGHDDVKTGGNYKKGGPVTPENYRKYKDHRHEFGAQGVGPTQLTFPGFQDEADERGGCFDFGVNCAVGFEKLAGFIKANGVHDGFREYNGGPHPSDPAAAESYADDAVKKLAVWRSRLHGLEDDMTVEEFVKELNKPGSPARSAIRELAGMAVDDKLGVPNTPETNARKGVKDLTDRSVKTLQETLDQLNDKLDTLLQRPA